MGKDRQEHSTHCDILKAGKMREKIPHEPSADLPSLNLCRELVTKLVWRDKHC
jgi:hypothetical protein